ncbi:hypothetical protein CCM_04380 [Cordyceps militaris CM01]|uniref:Uncharacterized protein n=1 Tax=Cordyceps militaris (strain CM01) TaxID=983644 RepID=G3JEP9_CORMM|nr:uncharacterized protein CCM_04380 [Cordyceps militaris CM01]EGX93008.1 hypothetical protein CCM_04380 [Cordyceps militaris CM01]
MYLSNRALPAATPATAAATPTFTPPAAWRDELTGQVFNASPDDLNGTSAALAGDSGLGPLRLLIPITVAGWVMFGAGCILCINGRGRAGRWVPEWYLDSAGTRRDKALVASWWLAVLLFWPVILLGLLVSKVVRRVAKVVAKRRDRKRTEDTDEDSIKSAGEGRVTV